MKSIGERMPAAWIPHERLAELENEIQSLIDESESSMPEAQKILGALKLIQAACQFAKQEEDAGIYVG
ncbi:hypothetical protein Pla8534_22420 [Lignipirellula cremea]|uniref:Uncharacterized protein n=1 Tax=Lignipirellula cremea TaxID=2528010 RepID=A0A518DRI7_9BACT|nr:hypothetical protein Pla8534_22420 [Lignipirellula cremea]